MERERITISIKKKVLDEIDKTIDGILTRNRSHAIETLVQKAIGHNVTNSAVVLLGGDNALKAVPAAKNFLSIIDAAEYDRVYVAAGFLGNKIKDALGDDSDYNFTLEYSQKGEGSGGALLALKNQIKSETFIVCNSPKKYDFDLEFVINYHRSHHAVATILTDSLNDFSGIYIFNREIFNKLPKGFSMLEDEILPALFRQGDAIIFPINTL